MSTTMQGTIAPTQSPRELLPALVVIGALLLAGCGADDSSSDNSSAAAGSPVDRGFVAQMIPHHEDAVQIAQIGQRRGSSPFVKQFADDVVRTQNAEISAMRAADRRLYNAGVTKGSLGVPARMMGMDDNPARLNTTNPFARAFMRMMIRQHQGAVVLAATELAKGKDPELMTLAQNMILARQREISEMRKQLGDDADVGNENTGRRRRAKASAKDARGQRRASRARAPQAQAADAQRSRGQAARDMPYAQAAR